MPSIKITINGAHKFKMKVTSKKLKDIRLTCPEEFVTDTTMLFKSPDKLVLTEQNVGYLAQVCETHKQVLNVKPIFLKRISNLQSEIDSILDTEKTGKTDIGNGSEIEQNRPSSDGVGKKPEQVGFKSEDTVSDKTSGNKSTDGEGFGAENSVIKVDQSLTEGIFLNSGDSKEAHVKESTRDVFSILEDAEKMVNEELESCSGPNKSAANNRTHHEPNKPAANNRTHHEPQDVEISTHQDGCLRLESPAPPIDGSAPMVNIEPAPTTTCRDVENRPFLTSKTISLKKETCAIQEVTAKNGDSQMTKLSTTEDTTVSVSRDTASNTTTIRAARQREVVVTSTTYERDDKLFVRIVSPKHRIVTKYRSYNPEVSSSPDFLGIDRVGEAAKNLMSS
ncbi:hypothetical protein ACHWQZ_G019598 [Mnemiopsis leidyi]